MFSKMEFLAFKLPMIDSYFDWFVLSDFECQCLEMTMKKRKAKAKKEKKRKKEKKGDKVLCI